MGRFFLAHDEHDDGDDYDDDDDHSYGGSDRPPIGVRASRTEDSPPPPPVDSPPVHRSLLGRWIPPSQVRREEEYDREYMDVDQVEDIPSSDEMSCEAYQDDDDDDDRNGNGRHIDGGQGGIRGFFQRRRWRNYSSDEESSHRSDSHSRESEDNDSYEDGQDNDQRKHEVDDDDTFDDRLPTGFRPLNPTNRASRWSYSSLSTMTGTAIIPRTSSPDDTSQMMPGTIVETEDEIDQGIGPQNHYHIHFPNELVDELLNQRRNEETGRCCQSLGRFAVIAATFVALLAVLISRYGPPAPPPGVGGSSWPEFLDSHRAVAIDLARTWLVQVPAYLTHWCWQGVKNDVDQHWKRFTDANGSAECRLRPSDRTKFTEILHSEIFGQDHARDLLWDSLRLRDSNPSPLILFFSGSSSVGKRSTALALASYVYEDCLELPVLQVDAKGRRGDLFQTIMDFAMESVAESAPSILAVVTDIESLERHQVTDLVGKLKATSVLSSSIIIFTSTLGSEITDKLILRSGGIQDVPVMELQSLLTYHVSQSYAASSSSTTVFDAVIPFVPLERKSLSSILERHVQRAIDVRLRIAPDVLDAVLDHVPFTAWRHKATGAELLSFSPSGASPAAELGRTLASRVECGGEGDHLELVMDGRHGVVRDCAREECEELCRFRL